jgi:hypothetical protein
LECDVWQKNAARIKPRALACCCDEFVMHQTSTVLVVCGKLHHGDVVVLVNKNAGLEFGLGDCIHGAQNGRRRHV